jgi:predicted peptidase
VKERSPVVVPAIVIILCGIVAMPGCSESDPEVPAATVDADSPEENGTAATDNGLATTQQEDPKVLRELGEGLWLNGWLTPDNQPVHFVIYVPKEATGDNPVPLVLALHQGAGTYKRWFAQDFMQLLILPGMVNVPAIVVAPDVINGSWTNDTCTTAVMALMHEVCKTYNVDRDRILVTGYSMGGRGTWHFAQEFPEFFTAAVVIAGAPPENAADIDWQVPMLCIQSVDDVVFPIGETRAAIEAMKKNERMVQLSELTDVDHYETVKFVDPLITAMDWVIPLWDSRADGSEKAPPPVDGAGGDD